MIRRTAAIAAATWTELVRLKVFYFLIVFALLLIGSSFFLAQFDFEQGELQMLKDISFGAMSIFSSLLAILATAGLLPKDLEDRTIYTVLAKPVSRTEYVFGKLAGIFMLLAFSVLLMAAVFWAVLALRTSEILHAVQAGMAGEPPAEVDHALRAIRASGPAPGLLAGVLIILLKSWLLAAMTMFVASFSTSALFTILTALAVNFIGYLQATARDYWLAGGGMGAVSKGLLFLVALIFPDLQAFNVVDQIAAGTAAQPHLFAQMAALALGYVAVYSVLAATVFHTREL